MHMRIDHARQHDAAFAIFAEVGAGAVFTAPDDLCDLAIVIDNQRFEALDLAIGIHGDAGHIVDQHIGARRRGHGGGEESSNKLEFHQWTPGSICWAWR